MFFQLQSLGLKTYMGIWMFQNLFYCFRLYYGSQNGAIKRGKYYPIIFTISAGVTTNGLRGKCLMLPVTRYESSFERAIS